jgi:hypothetical protein
MTKSVIRHENGLLIELNKRGVEAILVNGEVSLGEYDGVEFKKKRVSEDKAEFVRKVVSEVRTMMESCPHVISIIMSDMFYVKFLFNGKEVVAFVSEDMITFSSEGEVDEELKTKSEMC